jgi:hypothetical protein
LGCARLTGHRVAVLRVHQRRRERTCRARGCAHLRADAHHGADAVQARHRPAPAARTARARWTHGGHGSRTRTWGTGAVGSEPHATHAFPARGKGMGRASASWRLRPCKIPTNSKHEIHHRMGTSIYWMNRLEHGLGWTCGKLAWSMRRTFLRVLSVYGVISPSKKSQSQSHGFTPNRRRNGWARRTRGEAEYRQYR